MLAALRRPLVGRGAARLLDVALIVTLAAIALQLVPLPADFRDRLLPAAAAYDRAMRFGAAAGPARPLSLDPSATLLALIVSAAVVVLFWSARTMFHRGGVRATVAGIAWIGLLVGPLAIVHHVTPVPVLDEVWGITSRGLRPYGPFMNRNDFAGWLIMAIPLALGYAIARIQSRHRTGAPFDPEVALDSKSIWLGIAVCLMLGGLLLSLSRSGLVGACLGLAYFGWIARGRFTTERGVWTGLGLVAILAIAALYADVGALATRFESSFSDGLSGRLSIWRQTWPVIRDFWPFGSGAGTYQSVMVLYQTMSRYFYITHADNEVLQILAEGGLLLGVPAAIALIAAATLVAKRLGEDRSPIFWLRAGAATGMVAIAGQSMVEMTLRVPANAVLFAIVAAIAVHDGDA